MRPYIHILTRTAVMILLLTASPAARSAGQSQDSRPAPQAADSLPDYPVLYEKQLPDRLVASTGRLRGEKLLSTSSAYITTAFTGRIAGLFTSQHSGAPGNDGADLRLRGLEPLVLVDGVPRDLFSVNPEQIESVTVLKDALSAAMLGMRSMNGALLITTRKGEGKERFNLDVTAQTGISSPLKLPQPLPAFDYATLYNEALENDGKPPVYSASDLDAYRNGSDPYGHPDVNWYDQVLEDQAPFSRYVLNAEGAAKNLNYFVSLDYLDQHGLFRNSPVNTYSTNSEYQRYIFRSNVRVDLNPGLSMFINLFGRIRDQNQPGSGTASIFNTISTTPANAYPKLNPDETLGGNVNYQDNIYGQSVFSGYINDIYSDGFADIGLRKDLSSLVKGWWVHAKVSYSLAITQEIDRSKDFETFEMRLNPATGDTTYNRFGQQSDQRNNSNIRSRTHQVYAEGATGYSRSWHDQALDVLLMYNLDSYTVDSDVPNQYHTVAGKVQYSIRDKYLLEAAASYSGNNRYEPGNRFGIFPALGLAWNIHKEDFFNEAGFINTLKIRSSYGLTGNAVAGYYEYTDRYGGASGYYFGTSVSRVSGRALQVPRDISTWEKAEKLDIGLDVSFGKRRGLLSLDYYRHTLKDLVQARGRSSALLGWGDEIIQNIGKDRYTGLEVSAGWNGQPAAFGYYVSGNFSISGSKVLYNDEPDYPYAWMYRTGHEVGQQFGYVADGFVTREGEGPVLEGYQPVPGDIRYKDLNGDGVINQFDRQAIGTQKPLLFYGLDLGFSWKGFSLSLLVQGVANRNILFTGNHSWEFQNDGTGQAYRHHLDRWTPENPSAGYPRLSVGTNVNNHVVSSFWVRPGDYIRLKNAEIAYAFRGGTLEKLSIQQVRLFLNGLNLLTLSDFNVSDPETLSGAYPVQRTISGGLSVKF